MIRKIWIRILKTVCLAGVFLLAYSAFFEPSIYWFKIWGLEAWAVGLSLFLVGGSLAKKTKVDKDIDNEFDELLNKYKHEISLNEADVLACSKCKKSFLQEDLQGFICPSCGEELSL